MCVLQFIVVGFKIFREMKVEIFYNNKIIPAVKFSWISID
jgi:hypothetical protein